MRPNVKVMVPLPAGASDETGVSHDPTRDSADRGAGSGYRARRVLLHFLNS